MNFKHYCQYQRNQNDNLFVRREQQLSLILLGEVGYMNQFICKIDEVKIYFVRE